MIRLCLVLGLIAVLARGQAPDSQLARSEAVLREVLNFEAEPKGTMPGGWGGGSAGTLFADELMPHSGKRAARIERTPASPEMASALRKSLPVGFAGKQVELRGFLRSEDVSDYFGLWLRQDGLAPSLAFASMQPRQIRGTTGWTEYTITLPLHPEARQLVFGVLLGGTGRVWADDLQLLVDGKPVWDAPKFERAITALDRDHEFDAGSKLNLTSLSPVQVENLARLGRVWGFLKYHHPKVMSGQVQWDYELFRVLPGILAAPDVPAANAIMVRWVDALGEIEAVAVAAKLKDDLYPGPEADWLEDKAVLGAELSQRLSHIYANRPPQAVQLYVSLVPGVGHPDFARELAYAQIKSPDAGFQLLALFRYWNIIRYWFPYRNLIGEDWDAVLKEYIPRVALAATGDAYKREMLTLIARINDSHASLWSSLAVRPPVGDSQLPVTVRFVEGQAVITGLLLASGVEPPPFLVGDIIETIDGVPVAQLVKAWAPYYAASNEPAQLRDMAGSLTNGPIGDVKLTVKRKGESLVITAPRVPIASVAKLIPLTHDLPGEAFQLLSKDVAYLKLSAIKGVDVKDCINRAAGTKGLIIDIRNYPAAFVVFSLGSLLVDKPVEFVRFTNGDLANPGAFNFTPPLVLKPQAPHYAGRVIILIDEVSQSNAEYSTMAFRVAPQAVVVGSTTAGADGNVMPIPLPGGLSSMMSGIGVFYPDKRPTQRIGIIPDVEVKPTLEGIRAGRDEVLEEGLRQILGPEFPSSELRKLVPSAK
jgi:hypothetical protein